jgi:hypothetical protein
MPTKPEPLDGKACQGTGKNADGSACCTPDGAKCCRRSTKAYPHSMLTQLLQAHPGSTLHHLGCSGATSAQLAGQVDAVLSKVSAVRPALVSTTATMKANIKRQVYRLLARPQVRVVLTELHNPFNRNSVFFSGSSSERSNQLWRTEYATTAMIRAYSQIVTEINQPGRLALAGGIRAAFDGPVGGPSHRSPKMTCGTSDPPVAETYIQWRDDPNSNSFPGIPSWFGISGTAGKEWRGDCFHPNVRGARVYANAVFRAVRDRLGFDGSLAPTITAAPRALSVRVTAATIFWNIDVPADSVVEYGPTSALGQRVAVPDAVTGHRVALADLQEQTTYHYRVTSANAAGTATARVGTFTTLACEGQTSIICNGACVDPATDARNCGGCGVDCGSNKVCLNRQCVCPSNQPVVCNGMCTNLDIDSRHCGACGQACPTGQFCCGGTCRDLKTDSAHCGSCNQACPAGGICQDFVCVGTCPNGKPICVAECCPVGTRCTGFMCCPAFKRYCGQVCCPHGEFCLDRETGQCSGSEV